MDFGAGRAGDFRSFEAPVWRELAFVRFADALFAVTDFVEFGGVRASMDIWLFRSSDSWGGEASSSQCDQPVTGGRSGA
jgi:hypothetical protein